MKPERDSIRSRLLAVATGLFAERGLQGVGIREICTLADANQGAVTYHFGGKRQLYRTVLREATARLVEELRAAHAQPAGSSASPGSARGTRLTTLMLRIDEALELEPTVARLLTRDLADGGAMTIETLAPLIREAEAALRGRLGLSEDPAGLAASRRAIAALVAPLLLVHTGRPLLEQGLGITDEQRRRLVEELLERLVAPLERARREPSEEASAQLSPAG